MKHIVALMAFLCLTACSEFQPFIDSRREAGQAALIGQSRPDMIAVCYNPIWDSESEVRQLAETACAEQGKHITYADTAYFNCRLTTPNTAFYACK